MRQMKMLMMYWKLTIRCMSEVRLKKCLNRQDSLAQIIVASCNSLLRTLLRPMIDNLTRKDNIGF